MYFTDLEKQAILVISGMMVAADGKATAEEKTLFSYTMIKLGVNEKHTQAATSMAPSFAISIIKNMTSDEKRFISALLECIMLSDNNIDGKEAALLTVVRQACDIPSMSTSESLDLIQNFVGV